MVFRYLVKRYGETYLARVVGKVLWPPVSVAVMAEGEHEDILVLDTGSHYELPGGIIDPGENLKQAGSREVKEETGYDVEVRDLIEVRSSKSGNRGLHFFFSGRITGGAKSGSWEGDPEFIDKAEASEKFWKPDHSHVHEYLFPDE